MSSKSVRPAKSKVRRSPQSTAQKEAAKTAKQRSQWAPGSAQSTAQKEVAKTGKQRSKWAPGSPLEVAAIIVIAVLLAVGIQAFMVKPYKIPSGSMEPTLKVGQRILANRIGMNINGPHVGEIVVFHPPDGADEEESRERPICYTTGQPVIYGGAACAEPVPHEASVNFIKRIVAGPGDEIYISEGHVFRKAAGTSRFTREQDPYIRPCATEREINVSGAAPLVPGRVVSKCNFPKPIKIPPGHWFMMGDNRGDSDDSRYWGPVPTGWIIGGAFATYWPVDRVGFL